MIYSVRRRYCLHSTEELCLGARPRTPSRELVGRSVFSKQPQFHAFLGKPAGGSGHTRAMILRPPLSALDSTQLRPLLSRRLAPDDPIARIGPAWASELFASSRSPNHDVAEAGNVRCHGPRLGCWGGVVSTRRKFRAGKRPPTDNG